METRFVQIFQLEYFLKPTIYFSSVRLRTYDVYGRYENEMQR